MAAPALAAEENAYDLLGRVLAPYTSLLAEDGSGARALSLFLRLEESRGFSMELAGLHAELTLQYPDKVRLRAPLLGNEYTLCRRGQTLWVHPGSQLKALLQQPKIAERLPAPDRKFQLRPFVLPVPEKQLAFLPALFEAKPAPPEAVEGIPCQVLDLKALPMLGRRLDLDGWSARLWVSAQARLIRFAVTGPETRVVGRVEKADFARSLPPETWVPTAAQEGDVVLVPPVRYDQLLRAVLGLK